MRKGVKGGIYHRRHLPSYLSPLFPTFTHLIFLPHFSLFISSLRGIAILEPENVKNGSLLSQDSPYSIKNIVLKNIKIKIDQGRVLMGFL